MRAPQRRPRLGELRTRLGRLRRSIDYYLVAARLGREARHWIGAQGSPTWRPSEDLHWRQWIAANGDELARLYLEMFEEELAERAAQIAMKANSAVTKGGSNPSVEPKSRPSRAR